jgi:OOP family OmpA-OmpF porin
VGCAKDANINLKGVNFETGSDRLTADSLPLLDDAAETLRKYPELKLEVGGHTDSSGNDNTNMNLSQARAQAVMKYLVDKGVKATNLTAKGYGETQPIASNTNNAGRAQNRRVELKIMQ